MAQKQGSVIEHYRHFFIVILGVIILSFIFILLALVNNFSIKLQQSNYETSEIISLENLNNIHETIILSDSPIPSNRDDHCSYHDCFNIYRCGRKGLNHISIYIYPFRKYLNEHGYDVGPELTKEFYAILKTIVSSKYYTPNPKEACIFVPSIDTLNQNHLRLKEISQALGLLP